MRMFPFLVEALSAQTIANHPTITATSLDLLTLLIKGIPSMILGVNDPFPNVYTTQVFPRVISMMLSIELDDVIMQNGQETVKLLMQRDYPGLAQWSDGNYTGSYYIAQFILRLLDTQTSESCAMYVGDLLTKLIQKSSAYGDTKIVEIIPQLLNALVVRLETADMPAHIQQLVLVFCNLIQTDANNVACYLNSYHTASGASALQILASKWTSCFTEIQGFYHVKISTIALTRLYMLSFPPLTQVFVRGDLIIPVSKRIVTRSVSKKQPDQWTSVSFYTKVLKLCLWEYEQQRESKISAMDVSFDEECEDLDVLDDADVGECWENFGGEDTFDFSVEGKGDDAEHLEDPVYNTDLKKHLQEFFGAVRRMDGYNDFSGLTRDEQNIINTAV